MRRACARKLFLRQLRVTTDLLSPSATVASKPGGPPLTFHLSCSARLREPRSQPFRGSHPFVLDGRRPHLFIGGGSLRWPRYSYTSAIHFLETPQWLLLHAEAYHGTVTEVSRCRP